MSWKIAALSLHKTCNKSTSQVWRAERAFFRPGSNRPRNEVGVRPAPILASLSNDDGDGNENGKKE